MWRYYFIALVLIGLDQWTKWLVATRMEIGESIPIINDFFYITSHRNSGAAWGILEGQMSLFYIITVVVMIGLIYFLHTHGKQDRLIATGVGVLIGGAAGNFIDRILYQEVVDFANFYIFNYNFPIFNIADASLTIGVIIVIIAIILDERKRGKAKK
ncbi:signal peptidase II [Oceanobacillus timonensis]|uniref:signal peptidase II n=1 Tax=Oceanobacillus timonensis TaxID=1926285 RepID=UPI0009BC03E2|nr:signal peptidase II [Oceanobacillus timonensis]